MLSLAWPGLARLGRLSNRANRGVRRRLDRRRPLV